MKHAVAMKTFTRSDTGERVRPNMKISGEDQYISELSGNGLVREIQAEPVAPEVKAPAKRRSRK